MASFWETVQVDGQDMDVYASVPGGQGQGPFPAVIVSQHGGGVDKFIQEMADRLAEAGYAAVAPNLFHRYTSEMLADRSGRVQHLSDPEIVADINATVDFLQSHQAVNEDRIGVTGFCMGGRVTWLAAASNPYFKAAAPYYGGNINVIWGGGDKSPFELTEGIKCPILFHFGEKDINPSAEDMAKFDAELTRLGVEHTFHTYSDADHAFMDYTAQRHNEAAFELSWPRTLEFFDTHLKN